MTDPNTTDAQRRFRAAGLPAPRSHNHRAPVSSTAAASRYDRSIVEGPLRPAVWKIAWPTMLTNIIGGLQGIVDHVLVGHLVGFTGNAAIGVAWQIFIVVIVFINSLFTGMSVLVAALRRRRRRGEGRPHGLPGVPHRDRHRPAGAWRRSATSSRRRCSIW